MLETWYWLDAGSHRFTLGSYKQGLVSQQPSLVVLKEGQVIAYGDKATPYIANLDKSCQVKVPIDHDTITADVSALIQEGLLQAGYQNAFLKPALLIALPSDAGQESQKTWQEACLKAGVAKASFVRNVDLLATENTQMVILAGHAYTEILVYAGGKCIANKTIFFGGQQMDEAISLAVLKAGKVMINPMGIKEAISTGYWKGQVVSVPCQGLNNRGQWVDLNVPAKLVWPAMESVIQQIVYWAKEVMARLDLTTRALIHENGILLTGGLAQCFGLPQALQAAFNDPIIQQDDLVQAGLREWRA